MPGWKCLDGFTREPMHEVMENFFAKVKIMPDDFGCEEEEFERRLDEYRNGRVCSWCGGRTKTCTECTNCGGPMVDKKTKNLITGTNSTGPR